jgi:RNA polymerase sigma-70 factor (ECF subfamily)
MALRADDVNLGRDRVLVELFQSGDGRAFEDLYRRYFQRIYRYCLKRVGDAHEAEELAQEAFVRAYSAMPRLGGDRRFYPWLSVIASRLCVDTHRRRGRTSPTAQVELGVVEGGQEDVIAEVDREILGRALDRMAPRHREVLRLREEEGWSYDRIAKHMGVGVGTVEALLFRARRALRREFHALAGSESRLAGLPVLGWLIHRTLTMRARLVDVAGQTAPMVAAGAVSAIVVVGTAVGVANHQASKPTVRPSVTAAVPEIQMPALTQPTVASVDAGKVVPAPAAPVPKVSPLVGATKPVGGGTADEGREKASKQPVNVDLGFIGAGLDPKAVIEMLRP